MKMKNKKKYLVWTALIALSVILLFSSGILTAQESSWLDGWDLRKEITITEISGNALTDYQVKIEVGYEPQMKSDFSDLRFTDSDGITLLNYWIEEYTEESSATVWVKVPEIPASGVKKIYMYYGNSGAASLSDGDAVFEFFDDFEDGNLDKWTLQTNTGSYSYSASTQELVATSGSEGTLVLYENKHLGDYNYIIDGILRYSSSSGNNLASYDFIFRDSSDSYLGNVRYYLSDNTIWPDTDTSKKNNYCE